MCKALPPCAGIAPLPVMHEVSPVAAHAGVPAVTKFFEEWLWDGISAIESKCFASPPLVPKLASKPCVYVLMIKLSVRYGGILLWG